MTTLAAPIRPTSSGSNRSSNHSNPASARHQASLSSSTPAGGSTPSSGGGTYQHPHSGHLVGSGAAGFVSPSGGLSPNLGGGGAGRPRQSLDAAKMLGASTGFGGAGPLSPRLGGLTGSSGTGIRPQTEMLGLGAAGLGTFGVTPETEAIDKWFEDLQSYEATLEEMAAASLDANFKEELSAIEQWFRVLSEAERTAALYSLLQSSTQVQIRFFITVLQQMARSDPMTALLSPGASGNTPSMEQQMEAKLAQLSSKSPASPVVRQFARQSLGADAFLSPHTGNVLSDSTNSHLNASLGPSSDAAALLERQRAKLKANRVSAPGSLLGSSTGPGAGGAGSESGSRSPRWGSPGPDDEGRYSRSPSPHRGMGLGKAGPGDVRPKSTGSELSSSTHQQQQQQQHQAAIARALAQSNALMGMGGLENQLSPILGGSWASQVNTPLVPMFSSSTNAHSIGATAGTGAKDQADVAAEAAGRLAQWGAAHQATAGPTPSAGTASGETGAGGIQLDDARKFRRQTKIGTGFSGVLSGMSPSSGSTSPNPAAANTAPTTAHPVPSRPTVNTSNSYPPPRGSAASPISPGGGSQPAAALLGAQQAQAAAMAAQQNWRNGLATGTGANSVPLGSGPGATNGVPASVGPDGLANNFAMMGMMNGMPGINMNDPNNAAAIQNMANLLQVQQQMQQVQQLQALQQQMAQHQQAQQMGILGGVSGPPAAGMLSPVAARLGMGGFPGAGAFGGNPAAQAAAAAVMMQNSQTAAALAAAQKRGGLGATIHPGVRSPVNKPTHVPGSGSNPDEELDMKLLSDIPAWLRGLRLHKYTPNFETCTWQEMVMMGESDLEARGVAAVGARRKMLRTFETVRLKKGIALPGDGEGNTSTESAEKDDSPADA